MRWIRQIPQLGPKRLSLLVVLIRIAVHFFDGVSLAASDQKKQQRCRAGRCVTVPQEGSYASSPSSNCRPSLGSIEKSLGGSHGRRGDSLKLGLALNLGFLRMTARPLNRGRAVPAVLLRHLGQLLDIAPPDLASLRALYARGRTLFDHQNQACEALGCRVYRPSRERSSGPQWTNRQTFRCALRSIDTRGSSTRLSKPLIRNIA